MNDEVLRQLYGTTEPLPPELPLHAGPLTAVLTGGALRSIEVQGVEVVRGLAFLIRDRNWGTVTPTLSDLRVEERGQGFSVGFRAHAAGDGGELRWEARIEADPATGLSFRCRGAPTGDLETCRTGFVVLHPLEGVVGCPVTIEHSGGRREATLFPDLIDPLQCFHDVRAITHEPLPGLHATCRMEGDAPFETEDHRNWLDASFKTYFRPLALPWPYTLAAGTPIKQAVHLTFEPALATLPARDAAGPVTVTVGDRTGGAMPEVGLACRPADLDAAEAALDRLQGAGFATLAARVDAGAADLPGLLRRYQRLAAAMGAAVLLEIVLPLAAPAAAELDLVAVAAGAAGLRPRSVAVSPAVDLRSYPPSVDRPPSPPLASIYAAARAAFPGRPLGGGMFSFFTELNRRRPPAHLLDFVQHATSAVVHAADDRSVMETLESLPHVIRSTRAIVGALPYRLGPAQIGMAQNPYGASTAANPDRVRRAMAEDDPRAGALFGAAWAAGYLARATAGGIDGVSIMAPAGPFGVAHPGGVTPAFHVLSSFAEAAGSALLAAVSSDPRRVLACACVSRGRRRAWLANLTAEPQPVSLSGLRPSEVRLLDGRQPRLLDTLRELPPFAVAFLDG